MAFLALAPFGPSPRIPTGARVVDSTELNLLTRDGAIAVAFYPAVEAD
jgi:hypothetical protein